MENKTLERINLGADVRQTKEYGKYMETMGWETVKLSKSQMFIKKIGPVAIAKWQRPEGWQQEERLGGILKQKRVMMCKWEPRAEEKEKEVEEWIEKKGFKLDKWPLLPTKTLVVDLSLPLDELFKRCDKDCRYTLRRIEQINPKVIFDDPELTYAILKKAASRKRLWLMNQKTFTGLVGAFGKKCICIVVEGAAAVILQAEKTAYYYLAGAEAASNQKNYPYWGVWKGMEMAKARGSKVWDFEGIYDERWSSQNWQGFSRFKRGFGGEEVKFLGCYTKWKWPFS